jgi:hypothetical protein
MTKSNLVYTILAASVLVAGFFALSPNLQTTVQAQAPAKDVSVVNTISANVVNPLVPTFCPPANVQHWDKIIFQVIAPIISTLQPGPDRAINPPQLFPGVDYDIKVKDMAGTVTDLNERVALSL